MTRDEHSLQYSSRPLDAAKSPSLGLKREQSMKTCQCVLTCSWSTSSSPVMMILFSIRVSEYPPFTVCNTRRLSRQPQLLNAPRRTAEPHFTPPFTQNSAAIKSGAIHRFGPTFVTWVVAEVTFSAMRMGEPADSLPRLLTCTWGRRGRERGRKKTRVRRKLLQIHKYMQILRAKSYLGK